MSIIVKIIGLPQKEELDWVVFMGYSGCEYMSTIFDISRSSTYTCK